MRRFLTATLSLFSVMAIFSATANAHTTVFENGFFFITEPTVFDDIYVGEGAIVALVGDILVTGDIEVECDAWLSTSGIVVEGDIEFEGATIVELGNTTVGGDVEVTHTGGEPILSLLPLVSLFNNTICGNVKASNNNVNSITITGNKIGGKLQVRKNVANFTNIANNTTGLKCRK